MDKNLFFSAAGDIFILASILPFKVMLFNEKTEIQG